MLTANALGCGNRARMKLWHNRLKHWTCGVLHVSFVFLVLICKVFIQQYADHLYWPLCYLHVRASTLNASRISGISSIQFMFVPKQSEICTLGKVPSWWACEFCSCKDRGIQTCECPEISPYLYAVFLRFSTFFLLSILGCQLMSIHVNSIGHVSCKA